MDMSMYVIRSEKVQKVHEEVAHMPMVPTSAILPSLMGNFLLIADRGIEEWFTGGSAWYTDTTQKWTAEAPSPSMDIHEG